MVPRVLCLTEGPIDRVSRAAYLENNISLYIEPICDGLRIWYRELKLWFFASGIDICVTQGTQ